MRISEVSRLTGASAKAIRLYEARGLLPPVARVNRYRYRRDSVWWDRLLAGRSARVITTLDTPPWYYR
ncbi:NAD(P)H dehydrogenase (quinone) [Stenotrophomonas sp. SKA14]|nr:NAD(P)H dehydrogenase (quinone) [Stenotrophomonas sp. SKA14]